MTVLILLATFLLLDGVANGVASDVASWNSLLRCPHLFQPHHDVISRFMKNPGNSGEKIKDLKAMLDNATILSQVYQNYLILHGKEGRNEEAVFARNALKIAEHNIAYDAGRKSWDQQVNFFTDMTSAELETYGCLKDPTPSPRNFRFDFDDELTTNKTGLQAPTSLDWREENGVTPIKNQGRCGSCWAFASVAVLESFMLRKDGEPTILSEQEMVDCEKQSKGCQYGFINTAFDYLKQHGVMSSADYPYKTKAGDCKRGQEQAAGQIGSFSTTGYRNRDEEKLKELVARYGPTAVGVNIGNDWYNYNSGVYDGACGRGGHFLTIVGYGSESGKDYWLIKNSWGERWGIKGYMKIVRGQDKCGVSSRNGGWYITK